MKSKIVISVGSLMVLVALLWIARSINSPSGEVLPTIRVQRGNIVRHSIATGHITVEHEVPVKSSIGGILTKQLVTLGERVTRGTPIAEVRPVITSQNLLAAERSLELAKDGEASAEEFLNGSHPAALLTRWLNGPENLNRLKKQAELNRRKVEEQLTLLKEGQTEVDGRTLNFDVLAPVDGHILEIVAREGAPVVASSSYGSGSVLVRMADLDQTLFLGTVDEIDVGRLQKEMKATIRIGALPNQTIKGTVSEIGLRSKQLNNAAVFDVRITLDNPSSVQLRSGYSAVADIEVNRRDNVLVLPERAITFEGEKTLVSRKSPSGEPIATPVTLGLSDGLTVEIVSGLSEGDEVFERH